ncbi:hypothetical protein KAR91_37175 [Candidatus Pacearchaeota archaeon]|nr:hypothetical protein [Candidatus Pacearchaeota archaeon]
MNNEDKKVCKIDDVRLAGYTNRTRDGSEQVFYTGNDNRDWDRYKAEGGGSKHNVEMHDKPDTIRLQPPERHYYAQLIEGEWWWLNGCAECNGRPRDWTTYVECEKHNVCRSCSTPRAEIKETPWGGKEGWQCKPCAAIEKAALRLERLAAVASKRYDFWDYRHTDEVVCPHCKSSYRPDGEPPSGKQVCDVCDGEYSVEPEYSVKYTTEVIGKRLVA